MSINDEDQSSAAQKRVRKSVERFTAVNERKVVSVEGRGVPLGEIERVKDAFRRGKVDKEAARAVHVLCYRSPGQGGRRVASVKSFKGFDGGDEAEVAKRVASCEKINVGVLKLICDLFNISSTGKQKKHIAESVINFLKCPFETGSNLFRTLALKPKRKATKSKKKEKKVKLKDNDDKIDLSHESISKKKLVSKKSETIKLKPKVVKRIIKKDSKYGDGESDIDSDSDKSEEVKIKQVTKIKKGIKLKEDKIELSIRGGQTDIKSNEPILQDCGMEENETKNISDENITSHIQGILKGADLNVTTLNKVCDDVIAKFPEANLILKRAHIKQLVTKVINGI